MDYKYIEQLVDCYFEGETTLEEEQILRKFFAQEELPEHLRQWQPLFREQYALSLRVRLRPLFRVAAFLAFAIVIGTAVEYSTNPSMEAPAGQVAVQEQDELNADEATPLDIRSAELMDTDTLKLQ